MSTTVNVAEVEIGYLGRNILDLPPSKYYRVYHERGTVQRTSANGQPRVWHPGALRWKITYTGGWDQLDGWRTHHLPILAQSIKLLVLDWYDRGGQVLSQGTKDAVKLDQLPLPAVVAGIWEAYQPVGL